MNTNKQYQAQYEGSVEQGCSGAYIVVDTWNNIEVTGPMELVDARAYAAQMNGVSV